MKFISTNTLQSKENARHAGRQFFHTHIKVKGNTWRECGLKILNQKMFKTSLLKYRIATVWIELYSLL